MPENSDAMQSPVRVVSTRSLLDKHNALCQKSTMPTVRYADVAAHLVNAEISATALMREIRSAARYLGQYHGYSLTNFAQLTEMHKNSLMRLKDPTWVPKTASLERLERLITEAETLRGGHPGVQQPLPRGRPRKMATEQVRPKTNGTRPPAKITAAVPQAQAVRRQPSR